MNLIRKNERRAQRERIAAAEQELSDLRDALERAYGVFNHTDDPELLEASILEISALQSKYGCRLRDIKTLNGERNHADASHPRDPAGSGGRADRAAAEAAAQAYQMGV